MLESFKPVGRAVKYGLLRRWADVRAMLPVSHARLSDRPPAFIVGCGRSGTTILGKIFQKHPGVTYLFEPYHLWAAVDPRTDVINLYHRVDGRFLLRAGDVTDAVRRRFRRLILASARPGTLLIEKTPLNAARMDYLNALAPGASFVHIVRDGLDVARSIDRLASVNSYKIAGKPTLNQWWGVGGCKWPALARDAKEAGYFATEVDALESHIERGALEWLVSLEEVDRYREMLGDRLLEIRYPDLIGETARTLRRICQFLGVPSPEPWQREAAAMIFPREKASGSSMSLPPGMAAAFDRFQERYGFPNRATCATAAPRGAAVV